jgi:NADPH2:quinone reductase
MRSRGWSVGRLGEPGDVLELTESELPDPHAGQALLRVRACALNFPDVLMIQGQYQDRPPLPFTPGIEVCGEVLGAPDGPFPVGSRVIGGTLLPFGGLAEYALAETRHLHAAPASLDDARAASFTVAYQTAWMALIHRARLVPGETVLVHAAAGGVGTAAIGVAKATGARVVGVVGGADKATVATEFGADVVIDRLQHPTLDALVMALKDALGRGGADVVFDPVGGESFTASTKVMAFEGRLVVIGFAGGAIPTLAVNHALVKNYSVVGLLWGAYRLRAPDLVDNAWVALERLLADGMRPPAVSQVLPLDRAVEGLARLAAGRTTGRVVVEAGP